MEVLGLVLAVAAILLAVGMERLKRPRLAIHASTWARSGAVAWTFATVRIVNRPLSKAFSWILVRQIAAGCRVTIEYRALGQQALVLPQIQGRWSSRPEPWIIQPSSGQIHVAYDPAKATESTRLDLAPSDDGEEVAVAILKQNGAAFAWSPDSYAYPGFEHPQLVLQRGEYEVTVQAQAGGVSTSARFRLQYLSGDFARFRLQSEPS